MGAVIVQRTVTLVRIRRLCFGIHRSHQRVGTPKAISLLDSWNERTSGLSSSSGVPPLHYHPTISSITFLSTLHTVYVPERLCPSWLTRTLIHFSTSNPTPLWTAPTICGSVLHH
ncbi:hypothetical protein FA13DRAFT_1398048 [Coprinellus micaceus]|uniref:Uncharacterized protein n=1 Tax=Coprinellus micaceus TaxID=71717 RepID=A0A4Y7SPP2_COPMI|nr:hypothetical protein FA13DRAFT_1398048 [Coprinellus micaceus]